MTECYQAAFCEHDITPNLDSVVPLQGFWKTKDRSAQYISSALKLQILLLEDQKHNRLLVVSADIFGFDETIFEAVSKAAARHEIPRSNILLNASHTHYAPGTFNGMLLGMGTVDSVFVQRIVTVIEDSLPMLANALQPASVDWWIAKARIGFNRRLVRDGQVLMKPAVDGYYESRTPVIRIKCAERYCLLINHGCHPTGLQSLPVISSDFVGAARERLLSDCPDIEQVMFLQGAAGNIKHGDYRGSYPAWSSDEEATRRAGERLANKVSDIVKTPVQGQANGLLECGYGEFEAPLSAKSRSLEEELNQPESIIGSPGLAIEWAQWMQQNGKAQVAESLHMSVWTARIGGLYLIALPGEPVAELADMLVKSFSERGTVAVLGYTNGIRAYLPTDAIIREGGYEAYRSHFVYLLPSAIALGFEAALVTALKIIKRDQ